MKIGLIFIFLSLSIPFPAQERLSDKQIIFGENQNIFTDNKLEKLQRFTPDLQNIFNANKLLEDNLKNENLKFDDYYIQFAGIFQFDQKFIYFNASCTKPEYFEKNISPVKGGGKCYFSGLVNIDQNYIERFNFNALK